MQDGRNSVWSIPYVSLASFQVENRILLHIVLPHVKIAFLKFPIFDNQGLLGCIPIAAVDVHLNFKS